MATMAGAARSHAILTQLAWRNRIVDLLRIAVPLTGALVFAVLVGQIMLAGLLRSYGVAGLHIDRGNLVVEAPRYSGLGSDGSRYLVTAAEARTGIGQTNLVDMTDVRLNLGRPGKAELHATAATATADMNRKTVTVPGLTVFHDDAGMRGTLTDLRATMGSSDLVAQGPVDISFPDGSHLTADTMVRKADQQTWTFTRATLVMPDLPRSPLPPIPFVTSLWVVK